MVLACVLHISSSAGPRWTLWSNSCQKRSRDCIMWSHGSRKDTSAACWHVHLNPRRAQIKVVRHKLRLILWQALPAKLRGRSQNGAAAGASIWQGFGGNGGKIRKAGICGRTHYICSHGYLQKNKTPPCPWTRSAAYLPSVMLVRSFQTFSPLCSRKHALFQCPV